MPKLKQPKMELMKITPKMAAEMLEGDKRPDQEKRKIYQTQVDRIIGQINNDDWQYNAETIKVTKKGFVGDGNHRLWASVLSEKPIISLVVWDVPDEAIDTVDTMTKLRTGGDSLFRKGVKIHSSQLSAALSWLVRYQRGVIGNNRGTQANRVENVEILKTNGDHPNMIDSVQRCKSTRLLVPTGLMAFALYILSNKSEERAEELIEVLEDPSNTPVMHPFFQLRSSLLKTRERAVTTGGHRSPVMLLGLVFKAWNLHAEGKKIKVLIFRMGGAHPEKLPVPQ